MLIRGLFGYTFRATTLELVPRIPAAITELHQHFGVRWGAYRIFIAAHGPPTTPISSVLINNASVRCFNATSITLEYYSLPPPSDAAKHAVTSSVSTEATRINLTIVFGHAQLRQSPQQLKRDFPAEQIVAIPPASNLLNPPVTPGLALWFDASRITAKTGSNISIWHDLSGNQIKEQK